MIAENIILISFGFFERNILDKVCAVVEAQFQVPVKTREGHIDLSEYYDPARRQYDGNRLLKMIEQKYANDLDKTLGLFNVDLFIPILTYIFGQAYLNGKAGLASIYRLNNERYGLKADETLTLDRFRKEIIHELGHTFGLIHCHDQSCVMRASTYVEDIDQKQVNLCEKCRETLGVGRKG